MRARLPTAKVQKALKVLKLEQLDKWLNITELQINNLNEGLMIHN